MGYYCTVPQCTSLAGKTKNVKFHRFPRDVTMADKWNIILKRGKPYTKYSKVCSLHFTQADYNVTTMGQWKTLSKDAVPSQNLPKLNPDGTVMVIRKSRTVKYREGKKDEIHGEKMDKWSLNLPTHSALPPSNDAHMTCDGPENSLAYRYPSMNTMDLSPQITNHVPLKPKKQDAFMQTDPVQSEEDDSQPNNSYSEVSDKYTSDNLDFNQSPYQKDQEYDKKYEAKDYTNKPDDYIPQTNEEYNKEAEKYALERKSLNGYEKPLIENFPKPVENYQKINDLYTGFDKPFRTDYSGYQNYPDSVELLRNQQHNLQMLQEQHRITENQNFFNENHIKQEIDINVEDDKFLYERNKEQLDADMYNSRRLIDQQRLLEQIQHQVKQEPDTPSGCENVIQPQGSPYYQSNNHNNVSAGGYYEQLSRPGPELLIAKQNALAAHTQLWQNTMKRPFFYSESPHYNSAPLLHRYEDITRILQ